MTTLEERLAGYRKWLEGRIEGSKEFIREWHPTTGITDGEIIAFKEALAKFDSEVLSKLKEGEGGP